MADSNSVPYWGYYGTQNYFDTDPNASAQGRDFLAGLRKLDPNASFVQTTMGDSGSPVWRLQTNVQFPGVDLNAGDFNPQYADQFGYSGGTHSFDTSQLKDPSLTQQSNVFGAYSPWSNLKPQSATALDYIGPAVVAAFGGLASAGLLGAGGGGFDLGAATPMDTMAPYSPTYGDMLPFNPSEADIGLSGAANAPLGSAESSLFGQGALTDPAQALGGSFDPNLTLGGDWYPQMTPGYEQMAPFNPASPEYGQFAINPDGTPAAGAGGLPGVGSGFKMPSLSDITSALGKIPGLTGGSGTSSGSGGGGGGLLNLPPSQYGSLAQVVKRYLGGGLLNG